jgi:hypothetical protein
MYICHAMCTYSVLSVWFRTKMHYPHHNVLIPSLPPHTNKFKLPSKMSLYYPSRRPHNKHSNVQLQFLSVCRLQQLDMPSRLTVVLVSLLVATPAVMFWLWLVIQRVRVAILCPEECWCRPGGYLVDCTLSSLKIFL